MKPPSASGFHLCLLRLLLLLLPPRLANHLHNISRLSRSLTQRSANPPHVTTQDYTLGLDLHVAHYVWHPMTFWRQKYMYVCMSVCQSDSVRLFVILCVYILIGGLYIAFTFSALVKSLLFFVLVIIFCLSPTPRSSMPAVCLHHSLF